MVKGLNRGNGDGQDSMSSSNDLGQCGTSEYDDGRRGFVTSGRYVDTVRISGGKLHLWLESKSWHAVC